MIIYVNTTSDDLSRRLLEDLQASGLFIRLTPDETCVAWINLLTSASSVGGRPMPTGDQPVIHVRLAPENIPANLPGTVVDLSTNYMTGYRELIRQLHAVLVSQKNNPYRGLLAYSEVEARLFFGRGAFTKTVHDRIANDGRLLALVGASGSGKTSFIRAGLMARLRKDGDACTPLAITLGDDPIRQLARRLQPFLTSKGDLVSRLYSNPAALGDLLAEVSAGQGKVFLALDSFEGIFTRASLADRVYFLDSLFDAINRDSGNYVVCVALRADFKDKLLEYPKWNRLLEATTFVMPDFTRDELTEMIQSPAKETGLTPHDDLVKRLPDDAARAKQTALLALSFVLEQLAATGQMNVKQYDAMGGLSGVVGLYAEKLYQSLTPIRQNAAKRILLQGIEITDDSKQVVRPVERARLAFSWASAEDIEQTVAALVNGNLLCSSVDAESGEATLQPIHELLPALWPRYQEWVNQEAENLRYGSHLERLAATWSARDYSEQALLRGSTLDEAINWTQNTDHLPSLLLQNYVAVSSEIRRNYETQQKRGALRQRGVNVALIVSFLVAILVIVGGAFLLVRTVNERDQVRTLQVSAENNLATATAQNAMLEVTLDAAGTMQADSQIVIATSAAQYHQAATGQAVAQNDQATAVALAESQQARLAAQATTNSARADATIDALVSQQSAAATAVANAQTFQATLDASLQTQQLLTEYIAGQLARTSSGLLSTDPVLALRLAAEAATRIIQTEAEDSNPLIGQAMRAALKANSTFRFGGDILQTWFLDGNQFAAINNADEPDQLWSVNPPEVVAEFEHPVEQIIPIANGKLLLVDYADDAVDELWRTEEQVVAAQLTGDLASPPDPTLTVKIPNVVQLDNNTFFLLKYSDGLASELWDAASGERVTALDGDLEAVTPLKDGYFFVRYVDQTGAIWQTSSGQLVQPAADVITTFYDNGIFALRQDRQFDEIWRTNPFASVTPVVGRVGAVTNLRGTPYFIVQYTGKTPAEIWRDDEPEAVYKFRGPIDNSVTFLNNQYFFIRYDDKSASEIWSTNPLQMAVALNGHLANGGVIPVLGEEEVVIDYENNAVSEVWSLKDQTRLAQLNGNVKKVLPILGDVFFVVQYEEDRPPEIWSAVDARLIASLGEENRVVLSITTLKDGNFLVILYQAEPAEVWQVGADSVARLATLPDVATQVYPFENDDYAIVNFLNMPAQIWQTGVDTPIFSLTGTVSQVAYNRETMRLSLTTLEDESFVISIDRLTQVEDENTGLSDVDLLALVCQQLEESSPIPEDALAIYMGGLAPSACPPSAPSD